MRSVLALGSALAVLLLAAPSFAKKTHYKSAFEGGTESAAKGTGNYTFDDVTKKLCGKITYTPLEGGAMTGAALKSANGLTLVKTIPHGASPLNVNVTLTDAEIMLLNDSDLYIGLGTAAKPVGNANNQNGEINGEILEDKQGVEQPCSDGVSDGGTEAGTSSSSSSSSGSSGTSGGTSSGEESSSGNPTEPPADEPSPPAAEEGGCSTSGGGGGGLGLAALAAAFAVAVARGRSRRR